MKIVSPEEVGLASDRLGRIRPAIEKHIGEDRLAGAVTLLARKARIVHLEAYGLQDRESQKSMSVDTIFRIYSMTKPITCVAFMTLFEEGLVRLYEPVARYIPAFKDIKVFSGDDDNPDQAVDLERPVTVWNLLTHTSGLTYHFLEHGPIEEAYRERRIFSEKPLEQFVADLLDIPLAFQPGAAFRYSFAHDVIALLVEKISGKPFDQFLGERIFTPLGMIDTGFYVAEEKLPRFASMYGSGTIEDHVLWSAMYEEAIEGKNELLANSQNSLESRPHNVFRGGHGLVSTAADYYRFCQMLLNNGELDGQRILGRKTIELMTANHLPDEMLPFEIGGMEFPGCGYGLGLRIIGDIAKTQKPGSIGDYAWGGGMPCQ